MLCRQVGWLRSVLASKLGAAWSLLLSPEKVKLIWLLLRDDDVVDEEPLVELEAIEAGRSNIQGTATCLLPLVEERSLEELPEVLLEVSVDDPLDVPPALLDPPDAPELLKESTAKSIFPEDGFTMTSLMVPTSVPEEPLTVAPVSWLDRTLCCCIEELEWRLVSPEELPDELP
jgi:hypothetical protein